jgi:AbiV family abortive infection protein
MESEVNLDMLFAGRLAALSNAARLHSDADLLFRCGRYASSFFFANIATEELGKYSLIVSASVEAARGSLVWKSFWKRFRSHKGKTESLLSLENLHDFIHGTSDSLFHQEENKNYAQLQDDVKMKSLYSDYKVDFGFSAPEQIIKRDVCELANELLTSRLDMVTAFESQVASKYRADDLRRLDLEKFLSSAVDER